MNTAHSLEFVRSFVTV